ncbi:hypothetical protein [Cellulomonas sp. URHB0016]
MRSELRRHLASAASAACVVVLLAACGPAQSADGATPTGTTTTGATTTGAAGGGPTVTATATSVASSPTANDAAGKPVTAAPTHAPAPGAPQDGRTQVGLQVTSATWDAPSAAVEVAGFVAVLEADGVCHLVLTQGARAVTTDQPAEPGPSSTDCGVISVPAARLGSGAWTAQLTYESSTSVGHADPQQIEVP